MHKATATYIAPPGDSKVTEMAGVTFFSGQPVELNSYDHPHLIAKLPGNKHFNIEVGPDDGELPNVARKRGRPTNAERAAALAAKEKAEADVALAEATAKEAKANLDVVDPPKTETEQRPSILPPA